VFIWSLGAINLPVGDAAACCRQSQLTNDKGGAARGTSHTGDGSDAISFKRLRRRGAGSSRASSGEAGAVRGEESIDTSELATGLSSMEAVNFLSLMCATKESDAQGNGRIHSVYQGGITQNCSRAEISSGSLGTV
jgi:hypothetical protein